MKPSVVITHPVHPETLALLAPPCTPVLLPEAFELPREHLAERLADAAAVLTDTPEQLDAELLSAAPALKIVAAAPRLCGTLDAEACNARGVWLTGAPSLLTQSAAELAISLALALARQLPPTDRAVRADDLANVELAAPMLGIAGARVGILGMGGLGRAIAGRLAGWDAELLYNDPQRLPGHDEQQLGLRHAGLGELLALSDLVILALPHTPSTGHLINVARLALMKRGACLINPCRGPVADEAAVLAALNSGQLGGYAADLSGADQAACRQRLASVSPLLLRHPQALFNAQIGVAPAAVRRDIEQRAAQSILQALAGAMPLDALNDPREPLLRAC